MLVLTKHNVMRLRTALVAYWPIAIPSPGSYKQFAALTSIKEETRLPDAMKMVEQLVEGHEAVVRTARALFPTVDEALDEVTASLLSDRMEAHEKIAWMLRSLLT